MLAPTTFPRHEVGPDPRLCPTCRRKYLRGDAVRWCECGHEEAA